MSTNEDYDFGFSFQDEESIEQKISENVANTEEIYKLKLKQVEDLILPLLNNLKKNPDKPMINWPNREKIIDKQIEKILSITRG